MGEDSVQLLIPKTGDVLNSWLSYSYKSEFLTPTDRWTVETADTRTVQRILEVLKPGDDVQLILRGFPVCTGPLGKISLHETVHGLTCTLSGRDRLARAIDANVDPQLVWTPGQTMGDVFQLTFVPLGYTALTNTDVLNRYAMSGINPANATHRILEAARDVGDTSPESAGGTASNTATGTVTHYDAVTELYDPTAPPSIKMLTIDQFKPSPGAGVFEFWSKLIKRFGLWSWMSGDGEYVVIDRPNFDQPPSYSITRKLDGTGNNVEEASVEIDAEGQPSVVMATASGGGGANDVHTLKIAAVNELTGCDAFGNILPAVQSAIDKWPGVHVLPLRPNLFGYSTLYTNAICRPQYLHDDESKNLGHLSAFVRRTLAEHQHRGLVYQVRLRGHSQNGVPYMTNTIVDVEDEVVGIKERLWVLNREWIKSNDGTKTVLTMIRPYTLDLVV